MTITETDRDIYQIVKSLDRETFLKQQKKLSQDVISLLKDPAEFAREQAEGIAENLDKYFTGEKEAFKGYFAKSVDHHNLILENFWTAVCLKYNNIEIIDHPEDVRIKEFVFPEYGYGLRERMDFDAEGNEFGVHYEGYKLTNQPTSVLGTIATGLAMS